MSPPSTPKTIPLTCAETSRQSVAASAASALQPVFRCLGHCYDVARYAVPAEVSGDRPGHPDDALGSGCRCSSSWLADAGVWGDSNDTPTALLLELYAGETGGHERASSMYGGLTRDRSPQRSFRRGEDHSLTRRDVYENIESAERLDGAGDDSLRAINGRNVTGVGDRPCLLSANDLSDNTLRRRRRRYRSRRRMRLPGRTKCSRYDRLPGRRPLQP